MISKSIQGNQYPLYIQKRVSDVDQKLMCEDRFCQDGIGMAARSKHATKSCPHLQLTNLISEAENTKYVHDSTLYELLKMRMSQQRVDDLIKRKKEGNDLHHPLVAVYFPNGEEGHTIYIQALSVESMMFQHHITIWMLVLYHRHLHILYPQDALK